jgi:hypothetical protein
MSRGAGGEPRRSSHECPGPRISNCEHDQAGRLHVSRRLWALSARLANTDLGWATKGCDFPRRHSLICAPEEHQVGSQERWPKILKRRQHGDVPLPSLFDRRASSISTTLSPRCSHCHWHRRRLFRRQLSVLLTRPQAFVVLPSSSSSPHFNITSTGPPLLTTTQAIYPTAIMKIPWFLPRPTTRTTSPACSSSG